MRFQFVPIGKIYWLRFRPIRIGRSIRRIAGG
jgi:hypothetical protein